MNLLSRLLAVTALILAGFAAVFWFTHRSARETTQQLLDELTQQNDAHFQTAQKLQGLGLETMVSSYAWWDEMVRFMEKPDPKWASQNVNNLVGVPNGGDAVWVLDPELRTVHVIDENYAQPPLPVASTADLRRAIGANYTFQFFTVVDGQLWQVFGAAIQSAEFWRNETPVRGYLLLGKRWDDVWQARLGTIAGARLTVLTSGFDPAARAPAAAPGAARRFRHPVKGLAGTTIALIDGRYEFDLFNEFSAASDRQLVLLGAGFLVTFGGIAVFVAVVILRPLGRIIRSLETKNPLPIAGLLSARNEFGEVARLLAGHLRHDRMLQEEIRRHLENKTPEQRRQETESNEALRLRLAGNLHDGPIQSLYAAGLQLSAIESDLAEGKLVGIDRIGAIQAILGQATADLRNLLLDLEPEEMRDHDLESALRRIEKRMLSGGRCQFTLDLDERALDGLSRDAQLHLYYICRELASNALRHARPARAGLSLIVRSGFLHLNWHNDGLAPGAPAGSGNGLRNIQARVQNLGGSYRGGASDGEWRVEIEVPCTSLGPVPA